jgi:phospholipid transport system substrate-binding protein
MLTRRNLLTTSAAAAALLALRPLPLFAQEAGMGQATQFVQQTASQIVGIINGPGSEAEKQHQIAPIVDQTVDVNGVARFCLGRFWRTASPQQQQEYLQLFHSVLLNSVTGRLGDYRGVSVTVGRAEQRADGIYVSSTLNRPGNAPSTVIWVIDSVGGQPKIVDVIAEGTSLRLTQRSDYASYLQQHGNNVAALLNALRSQVAQG